MTQLHLPYTFKSHSVWGKVARPLIKMDFFTLLFGQWLRMSDILIDTGADISVVPLHFGTALVPAVELGVPINLGGSITNEPFFEAFIHRVQVRIANFQFEMPLAIASSMRTPFILGRLEALDRFTVQFLKGKEVIIKLD